MIRFAWMLLVLCLCALPGYAATRVQVLETWPAGDDVWLGRDQSFHLRLAYQSDVPVGIWLRAYGHGKTVPVGSSPSPRMSGSGETIGWFFFMQPGDEVDEIRITAGDGSADNTPVVATWHGRIVGGTQTTAGQAEPGWVVDLREQARALQQRDRDAAVAMPMRGSDTALLGGFMLLVMALGVLGIFAPIRAVMRWQGGWRLVAMLPAAGMAFVVLRIGIDVAANPKSHNLWPFEIVQAGASSCLMMLVLTVVRRLAGRHRTE